MSGLPIHHGPGRLIVHCGHHRCGTVWFDRIFRRIGERLNLAYHRGQQRDLPDNTDLFFQDHSQIDKTKLPFFVGSHIRRDPRDLVVSAYHYHRWATEPWLRKPRENLEGRTYQEHLCALDPDDGLMFEMERSAHHNISAMLAWDYRDDRIFEVKYEDLMADEVAMFDRLFRHYCFRDEAHRLALETALSQSFKHVAKRQVGDVQEGSHMRSGAPGQWRDLFSARHVDRFKQLFGDGLHNLGYRWD